MIIKEVKAKSILSKSQVFTYSLNPYTGCQHACSYCYARYMKRFTGHKEPWGQFIDVKVNAPELLKKEITKKKLGKVWVSGVCDPYQPIEAEYNLTGRCLEILSQNNWPVIIQTRSPLVLRDLKLFEGKSFEVGLSITTADDHIRELFEPDAPPIMYRVRTLDTLHKAGIRTYAMIAPILPGSESLPEILAGKVDFVILDRMNYNHANWVYRKYGMEEKKTDEFFNRVEREINSKLTSLGIPVR